MGFVIQSSTGKVLPEDAMRRLVEVVDACRGQQEVWVVFQDSFPYAAVSVHTTEVGAQQAAGTAAGLDYFGPVTPEGAPLQSNGVRKTTGTTFEPLERPVSRVVLYDTDNKEFADFRVNVLGRLTNPTTEIEALFFTPSSIDKYAIPYVARVYGLKYAYERRRGWIKGEKGEKEERTRT